MFLSSIYFLNKISNRLEQELKIILHKFSVVYLTVKSTVVLFRGVLAAEMLLILGNGSMFSVINLLFFIYLNDYHDKI